MKLIASKPQPDERGWAAEVQEPVREPAREERVMLDAIVDSAPSAFTLVDPELNLVSWNSYVRGLTGRSDDELRGSSVLSLIHEEDRAAAQAKLLSAFATGCARMELRVFGTGRRVYLTTARRLALAGEDFVAAFCTDITDRKQAERELSENKMFIDILIDSLPGVFYVIDSEGDYRNSWNSYLNKLIGLSDPEIAGRNSLLAFVEADLPSAAGMIRTALETGYARGTLHVKTAGRGARPFLMTARRFQVHDVSYLAVVGIDTTEEMAAMKELEHEARTDDLTQMSNRSHFMTQASHEFARCRRYGHALSLWLLDIDRMRNVNDAYGHQAGDAVLQSVAGMAKQALRDWDLLGRIGGEEFGVLLPETDRQQAMLVAERLRRAIRDLEISIWPGKSAQVTISTGITGMQDGDADFQAVLARADGALAEAKRTGGDKVCLA